MSGKHLRCAYCAHIVFESERNCKNCNAPIVERENESTQLERYEPFGYNGFIVWPTKNHRMARREYHFFSGDKLVAIIPFDEEGWSKIVEQCESVMPLVWNLFELSQGYIDHIKITGRKDCETLRPVEFLITRCIV